MELRHLRYFVAVAEELSFRGAADRLHIAQPSLSRQVRDLESEIGERLLERDPRGVTLTDAGRALLGEARGVLAGAEAAVAAARDAARGQRGELRIGNIGNLSLSFLPGSLANFRAQFPRVSVEIIDLGPDEQDDELIAGRLHVGFQARASGMPHDARFAHRTLLATDFVLVAPKDHPSNEAPVSLPSFAGETFLNYRPRQGAGYERIVQWLCEKHGGFVPRLRRPALDNILAMFGMVAAGNGLALLPTLTIPDGRQRGGWVVRSFAPELPRFCFDAVWNPAARSAVRDNYLAVLWRHAATARRRVPAAPTKAGAKRPSRALRGQ
jgi:DNA-binding transcriptional LysR family regulator